MRWRMAYSTPEWAKTPCGARRGAGVSGRYARIVIKTSLSEKSLMELADRLVPTLDILWSPWTLTDVAGRRAD
jgi:hypothetical protein